MNNVITKIKTNIESVTGLKMIYGAANYINRELEKTTLPCVVLDRVDSSLIEDENGIARERINFRVYFLNKTQFDNDTIENEDIIDACKKTALRWYVSRYMWSDIRLVSLNRAGRVYDMSDVILTGYLLEVTLEEIEGVSPCALQPNLQP